MAAGSGLNQGAALAAMSAYVAAKAAPTTNGYFLENSKFDPRAWLQSDPCVEIPCPINNVGASASGKTQ